MPTVQPARDVYRADCYLTTAGGDLLPDWHFEADTEVACRDAANEHLMSLSPIEHGGPNNYRMMFSGRTVPAEMTAL